MLRLCSVFDSFSTFVGDIGGATIGQRIGDGILQGAEFLASIGDTFISGLAVVWGNIGDAAGIWSAVVDGLGRVGSFLGGIARGVVGLEQPQHAAWGFLQDAHPAGKDFGRDFVGVVEAAEDKGAGRQFGGARALACGLGATRVVGLVAVWHAQHLLGVVGLLPFGNDVSVGDDGVDEAGPHGAGVAHQDADVQAADVDAILAAVTPRTRLVVLNNPINPTGVVLPDEDLALLYPGQAVERLIGLADSLVPKAHPLAASLSAALSALLAAMSTAPPPGTTCACLRARRTMQMASCRERSASSMNCSDPPRKTSVAVLAPGQPVKRL